MQVPCLLAVPNYNNNMQEVDRHDQLRSRFILASRHRFKKYYITHQLPQMDMGITNAAICYFEANPHLKKKEGVRHSFVAEIADHLMDANSIDWEQLYSHSNLNLDSGVTQTPGEDSDDEDMLDQLGVPTLAVQQLSAGRDISIDLCVQCSHYLKESMDLYESCYLEKKKIASIGNQVLKNQIEKRYKNCQVCELEGRHFIIKHNTYCKTHCVHFCIVGHTLSHELELKSTATQSLTSHG
jgi:hypothetical protein